MISHKRLFRSCRSEKTGKPHGPDEGIRFMPAVKERSDVPSVSLRGMSASGCEAGKANSVGICSSSAFQAKGIKFVS